jgi:hypothetical protein
MDRREDNTHEAETTKPYFTYLDPSPFLEASQGAIHGCAGRLYNLELPASLNLSSPPHNNPHLNDDRLRIRLRSRTPGVVK